MGLRLIVRRSSSADLSLKRYRFTGKERDSETGLDYFGVRYYASWLGRWTSGDPGGFVDGLNMYRYTRNNPVNGIDREGYSTEEPPPGYNDALQNAISLYGGEQGYSINATESTHNGVSTASITISDGFETTTATYQDGAWTHQISRTYAGDGGDIKGFTETQTGEGLPLTLKTINGPEATVKSNVENISTGSFIGDLLLGEIPFVGAGVDIANAAIDFHNGDYFSAALNIVAILPLIGAAAGAAAKALKRADIGSVIKGTNKGGKSVDLVDTGAANDLTKAQVGELESIADKLKDVNADPNGAYFKNPNCPHTASQSINALKGNPVSAAKQKFTPSNYSLD